MRYEQYDKRINKKTKGRYDITPLFQNFDNFNRLVNDMVRPFRKLTVDKVVGLEGLGFIVGSAIAIKLKAGFVPARKGGQLPGIKGTVMTRSFVDYTGCKKHLEMNMAAIQRGERILIADDWIETRTQVRSAINLVKRRRGSIVGITVLAAETTTKTKLLFEKYNLHAIGISDNL